VEVYARVRRAVQVEGMSVRQAAREFGLSRKTIRKMLESSVPPGYQRKKPVARPKLGPWLGIIEQILEDDESKPNKQRHTARRIYDRLKEEHAFTGGYTIVKAFVWEEVISCGSEVIARHRRSYDREEMIFDPLHYLALLEQKTNALGLAACRCGMRVRFTTGGRRWCMSKWKRGMRRGCCASRNACTGRNC
jgi:transposase